MNPFTRSLGLVPMLMIVSLLLTFTEAVPQRAWVCRVSRPQHRHHRYRLASARGSPSMDNAAVAVVSVTSSEVVVLPASSTSVEASLSVQPIAETDNEVELDVPDPTTEAITSMTSTATALTADALASAESTDGGLAASVLATDNASELAEVPVPTSMTSTDAPAVAFSLPDLTFTVHLPTLETPAPVQATDSSMASTSASEASSSLSTGSETTVSLEISSSTTAETSSTVETMTSTIDLSSSIEAAMVTSSNVPSSADLQSSASTASQTPTENPFAGAYQSFRVSPPTRLEPSTSESSTSETTPASQTAEPSSSVGTSTAVSDPSTSFATPSVFSADSAFTIVPHPPVKYANGSSVITPVVLSGSLLGISHNEPTSKYVQVSNPPNPKLPDSLLKVGVNRALSTDFGLAADTGVLAVDDAAGSLLADLKARPHLSRDGGKGGYLNGQKLFIFCDTGSYTAPTPDREGDFLGFVSSSVAVDKGMRGAAGQALVLEDGVGQWSDDVGRMRTLFPLTDGEQSYNLVMQGNGQRYAIWAESSIVPFNHTHALVYAPIVYDNVNRATGKTVFTYTGTTLAMLTASTESGPRAERIVDRLFEQDEVEWGTIAAFRSYGASGIGGNDGRVYVIGKVDGGLLLGRADAARIAEREAYEYWDGFIWSSKMPDASSTAYFLPGAYMDGDLIYSPAHLTFIFVYLSPYVDSTFYFRYLLADEAIRPAPDGHPMNDFAEKLVRYGWSEERVLYKVDGVPTGKYIYAGGVHQGYFDQDDLANGGKKLLLSWTVPTGERPGAMASEYSHVTAVVELE